MAGPQYEPLCQNDVEKPREPKLERREQVPSARNTILVSGLLILLVLTTISNVVLFTQLRHTHTQLGEQSYVGLQRNIPEPIRHDERTIDDEMWDSPDYDVNTGWVALKDGFTESKGLLHSMRWPWDPSKGIYVLHGFHSVHCVLVIRTALIEFRDNKTQTWPFAHVTHCLHTLREDVICHADDLPRYTGRLNAEAHHVAVSSGTGEVRMCRDWGKLREFAVQNSACYYRPLDRFVPLLDRYKHCPGGRKPWEEHA